MLVGTTFQMVAAKSAALFRFSAVALPTRTLRPTYVVYLIRPTPNRSET
jgi:hypothetical protein